MKQDEPILYTPMVERTHPIPMLRTNPVVDDSSITLHNTLHNRQRWRL